MLFLLGGRVSGCVLSAIVWPAFESLLLRLLLLLVVVWIPVASPAVILGLVGLAGFEGASFNGWLSGCDGAT